MHSLIRRTFQININSENFYLSHLSKINDPLEGPLIQRTFFDKDISISKNFLCILLFKQYIIIG